jgi:cytochrome subunit of sulfide dehydrogenase
MAGVGVPRFVHRHRSGLTIGVGLAVIMTVYGSVTSAIRVDAVSVVPTGRLLSSNCMQCHGTNGMNGSFNQLAGIPFESMMEKMHDQQTHSSIMGAQARGYTDDELQRIATYFASLPKP